MPNAQNGWPVIPDTDVGRSRLTNLVLPGGSMPHKVWVLAGDVATIARWHVREYHRRVESIKPAGCWGWNVRKIGNGPDWSNHSAACAWDLNAPDNPDGVPTSKVMTPAQIEQCHALLRESDGVLRWGGDYRSDPDAMHWEVVGSPAKAAALARKIRTQQEEPMAGITDEDAQKIARAVLNQRIGKSTETVGMDLQDDDAPAIASLGERLATVEGKLDEVIRLLTPPALEFTT